MITRAAADALLIARVGVFFAKVGKDGSTVDGTNADCAQALSWAVRRLGGTTAAPGDCSDADLSTVGDDDALLDLAEVRALELVQSNYIGADVKVGPLWEAGAAFADQLAALIDAKRKAFNAQYGSLIDPPLGDAPVVGLLAV